MDGHFVPNLTFGPATVAAVRGATNLPIEAHLMVERPELFVERFAEAGADYVIVHAEATYTLFRTLTLIEKAGARPGVALSPATPFEAAREVLADVVMALVMTVEPGFGGQSFIASMTGKVRSLREAAPDLDIEVDGGIDARTVPAVVARAFAVTSRLVSTTCGSAADSADRKNRLIPRLPRASATKSGPSFPATTSPASGISSAARTTLEMTRICRRLHRSMSTPANGPTTEYGSSRTANETAIRAPVACFSGENST